MAVAARMAHNVPVCSASTLLNIYNEVLRSATKRLLPCGPALSSVPSRFKASRIAPAITCRRYPETVRPRHMGHQSPPLGSAHTSLTVKPYASSFVPRSTPIRQHKNVRVSIKTHVLDAEPMRAGSFRAKQTGRAESPALLVPTPFRSRTSLRVAPPGRRHWCSAAGRC